MFGLGHFAYMILTLVITLIFHILIKKGKINFDKMLKVLAIITVFLDPIYYVWQYVNYGFVDASVSLPLYACSLFIFLLPIVAFSKKKSSLYRASLSCMSTVVYYGAILGIVLNYHLNEEPFFHFIVQHSLFYHFMMFLSISLIWSTGYYKVQKKDRWLFYLPLLIQMVPAYIVDKIYGYDYLYFNGGKESAMGFFSESMGIPLFLIVLYGGIFISLYVFLTVVIKIQSKKKLNP